MLHSIRSFFQQKLSSECAGDAVEEMSPFSRMDLVSAAMLIEVMNSDHKLEQRETETFLQLLHSSLGIPQADLHELARLAQAEVQQATSLYQFTRLINDEYDYPQKLQLLGNMWRIAFSDQHLDKYEEHLIRKVAELIHVAHSDFIKTKLQARDQQ